MPPKTQKSKNADARARAQARRDQIAKQERTRRLGFIGLWSTVGLVVAVVLVLVVVNISATKKGSTNITAAAPASVTSALASIPESAFAKAGVTGVGKSIAGASTLSGGTAVSTNGLPTVIYVGGEFCPYCAGERWPLAAALSRFGTLTGLQTTQSSGTDSFPNTATLSYVTSKFASTYVAFTPTEELDRAGKPLQTPPAASAASLAKFNPKGSIPFLVIDNKYQIPIQFDVGLLKGLTAAQIAAAIQDPTTKIGAAVLASANVISAGICQVTGGKPGAVCNTTEVKAAGAFLDTNTSGSGSSTG